MKWVETRGRTPRTGDRPLHLKFRNGLESKQTYVVSQIRWSQVGDQWDVVAVARG